MKYFPKKLNFQWIRSSYRSGDLTPQELLKEIISRAEKNTEKNIWIIPPSYDLSLPYIEALPKDPESLPLWGIPFAIKDNIDLEGVPTTAACPDYAYTPNESAFVVKKLISAGAIPVGKTNLDQFATGLVGTRSPYGEVHNAHNPEYISGGSSSGSAVAVALGMAAFALGTDTAGSGRVPAMLNTLVGYKPPLGAWSTRGVVPACASLDCVTVFTNNLEDALNVDKYAKGYDSACCWSKNTDEKGECLPDKIYLPVDMPKFFGDYAETYRQKWLNATKRIKNMGIAVEYIDYQMFYDAALILYDGAYVAERWADLKNFVLSNPDSVFPVTKQILSSGGSEDKTASRLFDDLHKLQEYRRITRELLNNAVMIMPTAGGSFTRTQVRKDPIKTNSLMGLYTNHCNLLDLSAIAVPENCIDNEFPFGITIFGRSDNMNLVCAAAKRFLQQESMMIAVCGLHKKGFMLESELVSLGAVFEEHTYTAKKYRLYLLNSLPKKPGLVRASENDIKAESIEVDLYSIPKKNFGAFLECVKPPLTIGNIELADGRTVKGFLCEEYILENTVEITENKKFI